MPGTQTKRKHGGSGSRGPLALHLRSLEGMDAAQLRLLLGQANLTAEKAAPLLGVSRVTLQRYFARDRKLQIPQQVAARALRLRQVVDQAEAVLGSREAATAWLNEEQQALGHRRPLEIMSTEHGSAAVEQLLGRIEYGIYT